MWCHLSRRAIRLPQRPLSTFCSKPPPTSPRSLYHSHCYYHHHPHEQPGYFRLPYSCSSSLNLQQRPNMGFRLRPFSSSTPQPHHPPPPDVLQMLCNIVVTGAGSLDDMETSLDRLPIVLTPALVAHVIDSCKSPQVFDKVTSRRLLRFFSWCQRKSNGHPGELGDQAFNRIIRVFAEKKDLTAMGIAISDLQKARRKIDPETFVCIADALVRSARADEAVRLFRSMEEKKELLLGGGGDGWSCVTAIVHALCSKGHARKAQGVVWHHKDKLRRSPTAESCIHRSLLHGWCVHGNAKEARRILDEMKSLGIRPGPASYNDFLLCICKRNLKFNPSALVPEATNVMTEMRSSGFPPTTVSFNILLSCLGRTRRVKEVFRILYSMIRGEAGCSPDWFSYYVVVRVLYLTGRYVRGNRVVDQMFEEGLMPGARFYHGLIGVLCGMEKVDYALQIFDKMKKCCGENNGLAYDLLISKLCRSGKFDMGRRLWDEAVERGIVLQCSSDLLDPLKTEVFKPVKKVKYRPADYQRLLKKQKKGVIRVRARGKDRRKKKSHST